LSVIDALLPISIIKVWHLQVIVLTAIQRVGVQGPAGNAHQALRHALMTLRITLRPLPGAGWIC